VTEKATVARALLGSWPQQVSAWGPDAINEYVNELAARGLSVDQALDAIRTWPTPEDPTKDFPPSASALVQHALRDPEAPSLPEFWEALTGPEGVLRARTRERRAFWEPGERDKLNEAAMSERLLTKHELVQAFVLEQTIPRLRVLGLDSPEWGEARRRQLEEAWLAFVDRGQRRTAAALVAGARRGELRRADPLAVIGQSTGEE
jgi:hypothetical protein